MPNTQFFGELLQLPETIGSGWFGSYGSTGAVPVPSVCHCEELCVSLIDDGCRSYRYYAEGNLKHCYIQSNLISTGSGYWGTEQKPGEAFSARYSWTSGTPGRRVLRFYRALAHAEDQFRRTFAYGQPMLQAIEALQISSFVGVEGSYVRVQVRAPYINYCVGLQPLPPARPRIFVEPGDHECALQLRGFAPPGGSAAQS